MMEQIPLHIVKQKIWPRATVRTCWSGESSWALGKLVESAVLGQDIQRGVDISVLHDKFGQSHVRAVLALVVLLLWVGGWVSGLPALYHPELLWFCDSSPLICFPGWEAKLPGQDLAFRVPERGFTKDLLCTEGQICQERMDCHYQWSWGRGKRNEAFIFLSKYLPALHGTHLNRQWEICALGSKQTVPHLVDNWFWLSQDHWFLGFSYSFK